MIISFTGPGHLPRTQAFARRWDHARKKKVSRNHAYVTSSLTRCRMACYTRLVIGSFRHKGLKELFEKGNSAQVPPTLRARCKRRLDALDSASNLKDLNLPGFNLHPLALTKPLRHSIDVNGPWCITFEWEDGNALRVDLEQYH